MCASIDVRFVSKSRCDGKHFQAEPVVEEGIERTTQVVTFDCGFLTQENADMLPILVCRGHASGQYGSDGS